MPTVGRACAWQADLLLAGHAVLLRENAPCFQAGP